MTVGHPKTRRREQPHRNTHPGPGNELIETHARETDGHVHPAPADDNRAEGDRTR